METNIIKGKRVGLVSFHTRTGYGDSPIQVGCGVYEETENRKHDWTGESLDGEIPIKAFLEWGLKQGYLKFSHKLDRRRR
ncbi:MAG: hypothetical protein P8168_12225 [Deltaproteobacteria bacterium]|jgi:hypothetical protein